MELKVWVEGIQRIVCGVTEVTTCQDVVFALAHATGKTGRFTLIERWRNNERLLAPQETPLKILMKWGEYSNDVQFILQRSDQNKQNQQPLKKTSNIDEAKLKLNQNNIKNTAIIGINDTINNSKQTELITPIDRNKEIRKSLNLGSPPEIKITENIGIVKGVPQKLSPNNVYNNNSTNAITNNNNNNSNDVVNSNVNNLESNFHNNNTNHAIKKSKSGEINAGEFNAADLRNSLDRKINGLVYGSKNLSSENLLLDTSSTSSISSSSNNNTLTSNSPIGGNRPYNSAMVPENHGCLVPPPYRDPPPPRNSPALNVDNLNNLNNNKKLEKDSINMNLMFNDITEMNLNEMMIHNSQYRDLVQLIKFQREKINTQQTDLTKFDAEILFLEGKSRDQMDQNEAITQEISKTDLIYRQGNEQLQTLQYVEEESELVKQQERTLKSEITLLRSKLANCETELLQCKNKIRLLMDEIQIEQRKFSRQYDQNRQQLERHLMSEVDRIQVEIDLAIKTSDQSSKTAEKLKNEVSMIENAIAEKKKQVEQLVHEMKEVNLQSLAVAPADEVRHLLEVGSVKPGSTRRIIGSPRQLENAVPTSKNPHGVWV